MAAVSRFVEFSVTSQTYVFGESTSGETDGKGTPGYSKALGVTADSFTINSSNNQLRVNIHGTEQTITLASGTDLDPRFVARDIEYKLNNADPGNDDFDFARCEWRSGFGSITNPGTHNKNSLIIWTGRLGQGAVSGTNDVNVLTTTNSAHTTLGWGTLTEASGRNFNVDFGSTGYTGSATTSGGSYSGQFSDMYTVMIAGGETVQSISAGGGNTYAGSATAGGIYIGSANTTYTVTIQTTGLGSVMTGVTGSVPTFTVTSTPVSDDNANAIELLYPRHWYDVGNLGARISFTDSPFGHGDTFTITASGATTGGGAVGVAKYIFTSSTEDSSKIHSIAAVTTQVTGTQVGTRGVTIAFSNSGTLAARERWQIVCRGPRPTNTNVTQLNFGNVTVSTNSPVKVVWFEIISGAVSMSTVKFSLQSDGTFSHHDQGDADTEFRFGTVGADNDAPGAGATSNSQVEFPTDSSGVGRILATDIDSDTPPSYMFATKQDLAEVSSADNAEDIGNYLDGVVSDFVFLAIKLGANETGANSTINYRAYFDFS